MDNPDRRIARQAAYCRVTWRRLTGAERQALAERAAELDAKTPYRSGRLAGTRRALAYAHHAELVADLTTACGG